MSNRITALVPKLTAGTKVYNTETMNELSSINKYLLALEDADIAGAADQHKKLLDAKQQLLEDVDVKFPGFDQKLESFNSFGQTALADAADQEGLLKYEVPEDIKSLASDEAFVKRMEFSEITAIDFKPPDHAMSVVQGIKFVAEQVAIFSIANAQTSDACETIKLFSAKSSEILKSLPVGLLNTKGDEAANSALARANSTLRCLLESLCKAIEAWTIRKVSEEAGCEGPDYDKFKTYSDHLSHNAAGFITLHASTSTDIIEERKSSLVSTGTLSILEESLVTYESYSGAVKLSSSSPLASKLAAYQQTYLDVLQTCLQKVDEGHAASLKKFVSKYRPVKVALDNLNSKDVIWALVGDEALQETVVQQIIQNRTCVDDASITLDKICQHPFASADDPLAVMVEKLKAAAQSYRDLGAEAALIVSTCVVYETFLRTGGPQYEDVKASVSYIFASFNVAKTDLSKKIQKMILDCEKAHVGTDAQGKEKADNTKTEKEKTDNTKTKVDKNVKKEKQDKDDKKAKGKNTGPPAQAAAASSGRKKTRK